MCFDFLYNFVRNISHSKKMWVRCDKKMYACVSCEVPDILVIFNENYLDRFSKNTQISTFMKIRPAGAVLFHADRRTWRS